MQIAAAGLDLRHARADDRHLRRVSYLINGAIACGRYASAAKMNFEAPLTSLVWITSILSVVVDLRRLLPPHPQPRRRHPCGGSSPRSSPAARWPAPSSPSSSRSSPPPSRATCAKSSPPPREGGASLNILSGLVAGNFSAYWMGITIAAADGHRRLDQQHVRAGRA